MNGIYHMFDYAEVSIYYNIVDHASHYKIVKIVCTCVVSV